MMAKRANPDMSLEEFDRWVKLEEGFEEIAEAAGEEGGPRLTLVPDPVSVPLDFLPDSVEVTAPITPAPTTAPSTDLATVEPTVTLDAVPCRTVGGWSADRQRRFIEVLAETGTVHAAAKSAGLSARGAYALRVRSPAFAAAWDGAQQLAVGRLSALAFDRAIHGRVEQLYRDGALIGERRVPSEKMLMWLLARLDPRRFAAPWEVRKDGTVDPQADAQLAFPALLGALTDTPEEG